jgi:L-histidine N-alpha-methyltransferase
MEPGDFLLLGADRVKDPSVLDAAYNDAQGITALFNLNVLQVLNRELGANFRSDNFDHLAVYNNELNRIEMYLVSRLDQDITLGGLDAGFTLECGERILTELSYKFYFDELETLLEDSGLGVIRHSEPDNHYFSLVLAQRE